MELHSFWSLSVCDTPGVFSGIHDISHRTVLSNVRNIFIRLVLVIGEIVVKQMNKIQIIQGRGVLSKYHKSTHFLEIKIHVSLTDCKLSFLVADYGCSYGRRVQGEMGKFVEKGIP